MQQKIKDNSFVIIWQSACYKLL